MWTAISAFLQATTPAWFGPVVAAAFVSGCFMVAQSWLTARAKKSELVRGSADDTWRLQIEETGKATRDLLDRLQAQAVEDREEIGTLRTKVEQLELENTALETEVQGLKRAAQITKHLTNRVYAALLSVVEEVINAADLDRAQGAGRKMKQVITQAMTGTFDKRG